MSLLFLAQSSSAVALLGPEAWLDGRKRCESAAWLLAGSASDILFSIALRTTSWSPALQWCDSRGGAEVAKR